MYTNGTPTILEYEIKNIISYIGVIRNKSMWICNLCSMSCINIFALGCHVKQIHWPEMKVDLQQYQYEAVMLQAAKLIVQGFPYITVTPSGTISEVMQTHTSKAHGVEGKTSDDSDKKDTEPKKKR